MKSKLQTIGLGIVMMLGSTTLQADEIWQSNAGRVTYADEMGPVAVWKYGTAEKPGAIYLNGLSKVYKNRGAYRGYWAKYTAEKECATERPGVNGHMTKYWGYFDVKFLDKDFPSRWEARWSYCDGEYEDLIVKAQPLIGEAAKQD